MTELLYEKAARQKLLTGAEKLYNAVKTTMGPKGRNVVIGYQQGAPTVTHDGVTVAKAVDLRDNAERQGAELIKEAAQKMNDVIGDGTTTVTVLTYHIIKAAHKLAESGVNPMLLAQEVEAALGGVLTYLAELKQPAADLASLTKIATISSGSEELGKVVAETVHKIGTQGTVTVEPSAKLETTAELVDGFQLSHGWISPYMVTDQHRMIAQYEHPAIVIVNHKIHSFRELLPLFQKIDESGKKECVIIAEDVSDSDALPTMVLNNVKGTFRTLAIKAPGFEDYRRQILDDLAVATGATVISYDTVSLADADLSCVGSAERVIASSDTTTFIGCGGELQGRIDQLATQLKNVASEHEQEQLQKRQAALAGKVAVIRVGGRSETEVDEKKFRVDDAVAATKAALADGVLPGGGVALFNAPMPSKSDGAVLLANVLKEPFRQLIKNSGIDVAEAEKYLAKAKPGHGYNVKTGEKVDLLKAGIIDPYNVTQQAVSTAVSLGIIGMTAGALVVDEKAK